MGQNEAREWIEADYRNQKFRESVIGTLLTGIVLVCVISVCNYVWGEQDGDVTYADCRNRVTIEQGSAEAWFKKFTCSTFRTKSGKVIGGVCVNVVTEGPVCQTVYIYNKKPAVSCPASAPNLGYDDLCHTNSQ